MVRSLNLLCQGHLAADAADGFSGGEAVSFFEAGDLGLAISCNDEGFIHAFVDTSFEQKRYVVDHHSMWIFSFGLSSEPGLFTRNAGVDDSFKPAQLGPVSENNGSQLTAIEGAVRVEDGLAERFHDLTPGRLVRLHNITGQFVGIDDDRAAMLEHLGDGALAGSDTACEADQNHGGGA